MDIYSQLFSCLQQDLAVGHTLNQCIQAPVRLDPVYVAKCALHESIAKKRIPIKPDKALEYAAIESFKLSNAKCQGWAVNAENEGLIALMRDIAFAECYRFQDFEWPDILDHSGLIAGSGASVLSKGQNSLFEKLFVNQQSTTNPLLNKELIRFYARTNRHLLKAEGQRRNLCGRAYVVVEGSALSTVRKNAVTDRTICTEPITNMLFQRALGEVINSVLKLNYGYDEALQPNRNRQLARLSSIDDSHATIDLSSASDTIALSLIKEIMPSWLTAAIEDCRSPNTVYKGHVIPLSMVSSMGNGQTFPLETYVFSLVLKATCRQMHVKFRSYEKSYEEGSCFGVFGDDIICPSRMYTKLVRNLSLCGFSVNNTKSFSHGFFRESCGTDWYDGYNVRGVYLKRLENRQDMFSAFNRLVRWSFSHELWLTSTLPYLLGKGWRRFAVPPHFADESGVKLPASLAPRPGKHAWKIKHFRRVQRVLSVVNIIDGSHSLIESHSNYWGFFLSMLSQTKSGTQPGPLAHLYPCVSGKLGDLARRDDDQRRYQLSTKTTVCWGENLGVVDPRTLSGNKISTIAMGDQLAALLSLASPN